MPVSLGPWWCGPDVAPGATWVRPIHSVREPTCSPLSAANRDMPEVWAVLPVQASAGTWCRRSIGVSVLPTRADDRTGGGVTTRPATPARRRTRPAPAEPGRRRLSPPRRRFLLQPRVECVAEAVAEQVEGEHGAKDGQSR